MPIPATIADLSTTPANNSPVGNVDGPATIDNYQRQHASFIAELRDTRIKSSDLSNNVDAAKGSSQVGHVSPSGVAKTVQSTLRTWEPKNTPTGALQFELVKDTAPLNYNSTRAISVIQHRDTANGVLNEFIPAIVNQFNVTGNGVVTAASELSQTIWQGQYNYMRKTGDGSAHGFTVIGELGAVGVGGYNELGMYQGEMTNTGSALGTMSGVEMLLKDSPNGGTTTFSTKMQAVVGRIAKYNTTIRKSHCFFASSEGTLPIDAILGGNPAGTTGWLRGFDFQGLNFTTGQFGLAPNNTALAWLTNTGVAAPIIGLSANNTTYLKPGVSTSSVALQDFAGLTRFEVTAAGNVAFQNQTLGVAATAGTNGATPAQVSGYLNVIVNGTAVKIPYYNQ